MKALLRRSLTTLLGSVAFLATSVALADGEICFNDIDCPGAECGGPVCNWMKPQGDKFTCNPAGTQTPKGSDGWCTTDADCKCKNQGAVCRAPYCTFTKASDAPAGGGTGAGGGSTAGTTSVAGTTSAAGTGAGGTASKPAAEESGGCSVASPASTGGGIALALGLVGVGAAFARRRRG